jgi:hypothetical protein
VVAELEKTRSDTFKFWWAYVQACRALALECGVAMRDLDRALWEYSNQNQKKAKKTCQAEAYHKG